MHKLRLNTKNRKCNDFWLYFGVTATTHEYCIFNNNNRKRVKEGERILYGLNACTYTLTYTLVQSLQCDDQNIHIRLLNPKRKSIGPQVTHIKSYVM